MGAGIGPARVETALDAATVPTHPIGLDPSDWSRAGERVTAYLVAMGVREPPEIAVLVERVRRQVETRAAAAPLEDPVEVAIEETHALLDRWLVSELGLEGDTNALFAARAAVLGGGLAGWSARWAGLAGRSLAPEIRALSIGAVPEPAPLTMEPNPIDLFLHRLTRRFSTALKRLLGLAPGPSAVARSRP